MTCVSADPLRFLCHLVGYCYWCYPYAQSLLEVGFLQLMLLSHVMFWHQLVHVLCSPGHLPRPCQTARGAG